MPVPVIASVAGRAAGQLLCEVGTNVAFEECNEYCQGRGQEKEDEEQGSPKKSNTEDPNEDSNRTLQVSNKARPVGLMPQRQESTTLFAKSIAYRQTEVDDATFKEDENSVNETMKKTTVHHAKDGEDSVFEVSV